MLVLTASAMEYLHVGKIKGWFSTANSGLEGLDDGTSKRTSVLDNSDVLTSNKVTKGQIIYRVWGGDSPEMGRSWTPADPQLAGSSYRNLAGLPDGNSGTQITIGRLIDTVGVIVMPAERIGNNVGGWPEYRLTNPIAQVQVIQRYSVMPPY